MSAESGDRLLGAVFGGRYLIESLLGRGGMASVYRAHDELLGRRVAAKIFAPHSADADDMRRQEGEVRMLASLSHPGLVTLYDAGAHESAEGPRAYLVMELIEGTTLRERMKAGSLASAEAAAIGADLADALHYIHRRDVVHRDVKPANILLADAADEDTQAATKLADFGIARIVDGTHLTATGSIIGTVSYLSPEQVLGTPVGPATDIYALGLVLLESITGDKAFPGSAAESASARIVRDPEIPDWLGGDWTALLRTMTAREPQDRPNARSVSVALRVIQRTPVAPDWQTSEHTAAAESGTDTFAMTSVATEAAARTERSPDTAQSTDTAPFADSASTGRQAATIPREPAAGTTAVMPAWRSTDADDSEAPGDVRDDSQTQGIRLRSLHIAIAAVAVLLVALGGWAILASVAPPADSAPTIQYPDVPGDLGTSLERLQESVESPE